MMKVRSVIVLLLSAVSARSAVSIGQIDDFQDGTLRNWSRGTVAAQPVNVSTGGPAGTDDRFLRVTSDGIGNNGKMLVFNNTRWAGDFSGTPSISLDFINLGTTELTMRLSFRDSIGSGGGGLVTDGSITLVPGSGWQTVNFDLTRLVSVGTLVPPSTFMTQVAQMRIIHSPQPFSFLGDDVAGILGIDNIRAVPEPSAMLMAASGLALVLRRRQR